MTKAPRNVVGLAYAASRIFATFYLMLSRGFYAVDELLVHMCLNKWSKFYSHVNHV